MLSQIAIRIAPLPLHVGRGTVMLLSCFWKEMPTLSTVPRKGSLLLCLLLLGDILMLRASYSKGRQRSMYQVEVIMIFH